MPAAQARTVVGAAPRRRRVLRTVGVVLGLAVLVVGGALAWRATAPPSGPEALPAAPSTPATDPVGWSLTWADEFDGEVLDRTRWLPCVSHGQLGAREECTGWNSELQRYRPENVVVGDGILRLVAERAADGSITSGAITTARDVFGYDQPGYREFTHTYGWTEVRFRAPPGAGFWPAVWGLPYNAEGEEIDHVEVVRGAPFFTLHTGSTWTGGQYEGVGMDLTGEWHTVATSWEPGRLTWYLDGVPRYTLTDAIPDEPFFLQANLAVGGEWPGPPNAATPFPSSFDIDYVRVYQRR